MLSPDQKNPRQGTVTQIHLPFFKGVSSSGSKKSPSGDCDMRYPKITESKATAPDQKNPRQGTVTPALITIRILWPDSGSKKSPSGDCDLSGLRLFKQMKSFSGSKKSPSGDCDQKPGSVTTLSVQCSGSKKSPSGDCDFFRYYGCFCCYVLRIKKIPVRGL